eukprot:CAMPEP_0173397696 /NCGR_PEP_ID=MMETSP1356-20130122/39232_1 /TAXON_ID=77927 ORGANISM="Hemiselmis virescens, Strain PCC157" /NCGR_SAMPLE_ID=MMETSP1356 /ASSEMBLY_ACC=CAM_ASM_000847 /LENGTH=38 /DNA_ID= /DNA_START= /DNA_END= /DNA_ORIENTATION=
MPWKVALNVAMPIMLGAWAGRALATGAGGKVEETLPPS